jgi:hypothetical protein
MSLLRHLRVLLDLVHRTTPAAPNSTYRWLAFRVLGQEAERSWVLMIEEKTGKMSAAVTGDGESFAIFGICPPS